MKVPIHLSCGLASICLGYAYVPTEAKHVCRYGFVIMDGNGSLFGTLSGNTREILGKFSVELPKKHGRGGQSALRFARLRMEKRHNYVRKVGSYDTPGHELLTQGRLDTIPLSVSCCRLLKLSATCHVHS